MKNTIGLVEALRKNGFKVSISHYRYSELDGVQTIGGLTHPFKAKLLCLCTKNKDLDPNVVGCSIISPTQALSLGGATKVLITCPNGQSLQASSYCSELDNYCKKLGVKIALSRLMSHFNITRVGDEIIYNPTLVGNKD